MIEVEIEGSNEILEFPDGTDPAIIQRAVRNYLGIESGADTGSSSDPIHGGHTAIRTDSGDGGSNLPDQEVAEAPLAGTVIDSFVEPAATLLTGALAEPVAGLAGLGTRNIFNLLPEDGEASRNIEAVREALTFQPKTKSGQEALEDVAEFVRPAVEGLESLESTLGDTVFEKTGSPALAAMAATSPTFVLEMTGLALGSGAAGSLKNTANVASKSKVDKAITESVPSVDQIKQTSRDVYKEISNLGVTIKPLAYQRLLRNLQRIAKDGGVDPDVTPRAHKALQRFEEKSGQPLTLTEIDNLRTIAQNAAKATEGGDIAIGSALVGAVDDFLDKADKRALDAPDGVEIGNRYKIARDLWGRAKRTELLDGSFEAAKNQASGFENGLRTQFRQILNNKNKAKFFKAGELRAMRKVVRGTGKENIFRLVGKLGFTEGSATQLIGGSLGVAAGATVGGVPGAVVVPLIGQVSKKLAQRMTVKNAEFANQVIRAGDNAARIAEVYLRNTKKADRSPQELSELLMRPDIDLSELPQIKIAEEAAKIAVQNRAALAGTVLPFSKEAVNQ